MPEQSAVTLLNVNDTPASLYMASRSLELAGYRVVEAASGKAALEMALEHRPDVVILDVKLPDMSGYEVCKALKANPRTAQSAIIHTSATYITAEKKVAGLRAGADVYLTQPFDPEELIATVNSIVRLRHAEQQARAQSEKLAEADKRKDEFLAMLAHELRNPLAAISTASGIIDQGESLSETGQRMQSIIRRQTRHLARLVDDLLDVSRITHGKVELRKERINLLPILEETLAVVQTRADAKTLTLEATLGEGSLWMDGDATRLEQVFLNLLDNAVKYSDEGGRICVRVETTRREGDDLAVVRVTDTGIGIPRRALPTIFDLFAQVDQTLERTRGGLGIGLTLVRRLVQMHGGDVVATSAGEGQGSEFAVRLPLLRRAEVPESQAPAASNVSRPGAKRVLLVEDNPDASSAMQEMLELWGHSVQVASDGLAGVQLALGGAPDVALVDVGLPGLDGFQVAERLRAELGTGLRLVALTGYGGSEQKSRALRAGFNVHLVKPVEMDELQRVLDAS